MSARLRSWWKSNKQINAVLKHPYLAHPVLGFTARVGFLGGILYCAVWAGKQAWMFNERQTGIAKRWLPWKVPITLVKRKTVEGNPDFFILTFKLPKETDFMGHDVVSALQLVATNIPQLKHGRLCRTYNPVSHPKERGYVDICVKEPEMGTGTMVRFLRKMPYGTTLQIRHVMKEFQYRPNKYENVSMLMSGGGITPAMQILSVALPDSSDKTKFNIIAIGGNIAPMRRRLEALAARYPDRLKVKFVVETIVNKDPTLDGWYGVVQPEYVKELFPPPWHQIVKERRARGESVELFSEYRPRNHILVCGNSSAITRLAGGQPRLIFLKNWKYFQGFHGGMLMDLGYSKREIYKFGSNMSEIFVANS